MLLLPDIYIYLSILSIDSIYSPKYSPKVQLTPNNKLAGVKSQLFPLLSDQTATDFLSRKITYPKVKVGHINNRLVSNCRWLNILLFHSLLELLNHCHPNFYSLNSPVYTATTEREIHLYLA